jgi:diguanylate cyclase (GGDEF)-like protein/PAS domain S-box-containing protein
MKANLHPPTAELPDEVTSLIESLHETENRLSELTAGEVDTVANHLGQTVMLRRSQDHLRLGEAARQRAILNALPARIAMLDCQGRILSVNEAWQRMADENEANGSQLCIGLNYLQVCDVAVGNEPGNQQVADGIGLVLLGKLVNFSLEYTTGGPGRQNWYLLTATPLVGKPPRGAVVAHVDITAQKRGEYSLRRFAGAMDTISDAIYLVDRATMEFIHVNDAACRQWNKTRDQVLTLGPFKLFSTSREELEKAYDLIIAGGIPEKPQEILQLQIDSKRIWLEVRRHAQCSGNRWTVVTLVRDITERKDAADRIAHLNRVYAVLSGINTLIVRVRDRDELFKEACRIAVETGGFHMSWVGIVDPDTLKINPVPSFGVDEGFLNTISERFSLLETAPLGNTMVARAIRSKTLVISNDLMIETSSVFRQRHTESGIRAIAILPLLVSTEAVGVLALYVRETGFFQDEELKLLKELAADIAFAIDHIEKQERLDYLAYYDVLTGLANMRLFLDRVAQYMHSASTGKHQLALLSIDLERFKSLNDSLGQTAGDAILLQVAQWLTKAAGDQNLLTRVDADHFCLMVPQVKTELEVTRFVEEMMEAFVSHPFRVNDEVFRIAIKVGVALFPSDGTNPATLFNRAEAALKKSKASGDRYVFYTPTMTATAVGKLTLENQLRQALDNAEFVLYYQPKVNLVSGHITGAEALIRWNDPRTGLVPPGQFIPILEETGLIYEVGRWALRQAIADCLRWRMAGRSAIRIAVNVSPLQLRHRDFITEIQLTIHKDAQAAAGLELEITESLIMADIGHGSIRLAQIRAMGIRIAIDDFGTGFSSLSYLSKLPIDTLKIDRSFVTEMTVSPQGLALVSTIIKLAHSLKLKVVAEGVENEDQLLQLRLLNCDEMQGYLFSKPLPREIFEAKFLTPKKIRSD